MTGAELYQDPDERIRQGEEREQALERALEPDQERGQGQRDEPTQPEPHASGDEMGEDNDGGPPSGAPR